MSIIRILLVISLLVTPALAKDKDAEMTSVEVTQFVNFLQSRGVSYALSGNGKKLDIAIKDKADGQMKWKSISLDKITRKGFADELKKILENAGK